MNKRKIVKLISKYYCVCIILYFKFQLTENHRKIDYFYLGQNWVVRVYKIILFIRWPVETHIIGTRLI